MKNKKNKLMPYAFKLYSTAIAIGLLIYYLFFKTQQQDPIEQNNYPLHTLLAPVLAGRCPVTGGVDQLFQELAGKQVVLFFYPKDGSPFCTYVAKKFTHLYTAFKQSNTVLVGISPDTLSRHEQFKAQYALPFALIADPTGELCKRFQVLQRRTLFESFFKIVSRSTFLFDYQGNLIKTWRNVTVKGHVQAVLKAAQDAASQSALPENH